MRNGSVSDNSSLFDDDPWSELNIPYTVSEVLVAIAAIIGNSLVIVVFGKERRLRRRTKYYIISLAVADLLVNFLDFFFNRPKEPWKPAGLDYKYSAPLGAKFCCAPKNF